MTYWLAARLTPPSEKNNATVEMMTGADGRFTARLPLSLWQCVGLLVNGVSVGSDETAREVSERQIVPSEGLRERFEQ
jgi:hypothetical protein